ncbi:NAD(P)H-dependent oxidoreductase [Bacteroidota bacterium]
MKIIIYNGSPRGRKSNTRLLMDSFIEGLSAVRTNYEVEVYYLASRSDRRAGMMAFPGADRVIIAFPLYTDSMPGIVKEFIDQLEPYSRAERAPDMGFVVQSGFPEPAHSRPIEKYVQRLAEKLGARYIGTVVKGGVEGIQIMPGWMTRKLYKRFNKLGRHYGLHGEFNQVIIKKLTPYERFSKLRIWVFNRMRKTRLANFYWDNQLKANGVFDHRFAHPFD